MPNPVPDPSSGTKAGSQAEEISSSGAAPPDEHAPEDDMHLARKGGIATHRGDPMKDAPTREGYGAEAGKDYGECGSPAAVSDAEPRNPGPPAAPER